MFVANLAGLTLGFTMGAAGADLYEILLAIAFLGTVLLIAGFLWAALQVERAVVWKHLTIVAFGVAVTTVVINAIILQMPLMAVNFIVALVQTFISMGIGGAIANTIKR